MRLLPRTLAGQLATVLLLALFAAQVAAFALFADERRIALVTAQREEVVARTAATLRLLDAAPPALRGQVLRAVSSPALRFRLAADSPIPADAMGRRMARLADRLAAELPGVAAVRIDAAPVRPLIARPFARPFDRDGDRRLVGPDRGRPEPRLFHLALQLDRGGWLVAESAAPRPPPGWALAPLAALVLSALAILAVTLLAVRRLTRPLDRLAAAAEAFGRGETPPPLPAAGPVEIRRTTEAFTEMQKRLARFVADRTRLLAAIGHDLRTPITSLRLRAEMVDDAETRERMLATLDTMTRMVEETLAFARDAAAEEATTALDLRALVDSLAEDRRAAGEDVAVAEGPPVILRGRRTALTRALDNLIGNAVRYGTRARVDLAATATAVRIAVDDAGPGIPQADLARVFEPFVRLETSRSRETGGLGLGLAVARTLIHAHGGTITLANRPQGGLRATVELPRGGAQG